MKLFIPHTLPLEKLDWTAFVSLIGKANAQVARFDSLLRTIPNTKVLLSPLTTNEAVLSSRIEGTQATLEEVFRFEANPKKETEKYEDIQEIINYRKAMLDAVDGLKNVPLSGRIIKNINKVEAILKLYKEMLDKVQNITHSQYTHKIVDFLLSNPWFTSVSFREVSGVPRPSAARMLQILSENKILTLLQRGKGKRPGYFAFSSLLNIVK